MTKNIVLFGPMGAGKTTVASYLVGEVGYVVNSLGKKIHTEAAFHGSETRDEMQRYGQAMRQIFGIDVWNNWLYKTLSKEWPTCLLEGSIVIDDGRQTNELQYWKEKGFVTVGIYAPEKVRAERLEKRNGKPTPKECFEHETEREALECSALCDYTIHNTGTLDELWDKVGGVLNEISESVPAD